jgi:catechol 2,3-dioxygenase-like lactoylglutathione lyase family enzyme
MLRVESIQGHQRRSPRRLVLGPLQNALVPRLATVTLVVADYDEAIAFFVERVGFELIEDKSLSDGKRWVVVAPRDGAGAHLPLARADGEEQRAVIGRQAGGRVGFFLETDDLAGDHARMAEAGVTFLEEPRTERYGTVVVFEDLYGNRSDLIEPARWVGATDPGH